MRYTVPLAVDCAVSTDDPGHRLAVNRTGITACGDECDTPYLQRRPVVPGVHVERRLNPKADHAVLSEGFVRRDGHSSRAANVPEKATATGGVRKAGVRSGRASDR